jgi:hypothetical protein
VVLGTEFRVVIRYNRIQRLFRVSTMRQETLLFSIKQSDLRFNFSKIIVADVENGILPTTDYRF